MLVASFNIRYDCPTDGEDRWALRRADVIEAVRSSGAVVVGLQEVVYGQLCDLQTALPQYAALGVARMDGVSSGEYSPVLVNTGVVNIQAAGTFWLSHTPSAPGTKISESSYPRICTWARLQLRTTPAPKPFYFFNTHFDHTSDVARGKQAAILVQEISRIAGLYPAILSGDFNCGPGSSPYAILASSYLLNANTKNDRTATFTNFGLGPGELVTGDDSRIDHIWISGFEASKYRTVIATRANNRRVSDHRMIAAEVSMLV